MSKKTKKKTKKAGAKFAPAKPIATAAPEAIKAADDAAPLKISDMALALAKQNPKKAQPVNPFTVMPGGQPMHPPAATPRLKKHQLASDESLGSTSAWAGNFITAAWNEGLQFLGYPYLAELAQRPEYRVISETIAKEMTRKWIKLEVVSDGKDVAKEDSQRKIERIQQLNDALDKFKVRDVFRAAAEQDGFFGRAHIFLDFDVTDEELKIPIGNGRSDLSKAKVNKRKKLKRISTIEAVWVYPTNYNAIDPTKPNWYRPDVWFVMSKPMDATRLLTLIGREVPDLLKPAYSFGGLALSQMAKPYVDNWLNIRQSVADIIQAFSVFVLKTNMAATLQAGGLEAIKRADLFNEMRNNRGLMMIDKTSEEFANVSVSLATLDKLQAQAQEHMSSVSQIPIVKLLGITPSGLNASTEGELTVFYDSIAAQQEKLFRSPLTTVIDFIQLSEFGDIDPDITFSFEPLQSATPKEKAEVDKMEAETDQIRVDSGALAPEEVRAKIIAAPNTPYAGLDPDDIPEVAEEEDEGDLIPGKNGPEQVDEEDEGEKPPAQDKRGIAHDEALALRGDISFALDRPTTANRNLRTQLNALIERANQAGFAQDAKRLELKLGGYYIEVANSHTPNSAKAINARAKAKALGVKQ